MQGSVLRGGIFPAAMSACGGYCSPFPDPRHWDALTPPALLLSKEPGSEEMMGLRSGYLPLQHPLLWFSSFLNASLPHLGAGKQNERVQTSGWDL